MEEDLKSRTIKEEVVNLKANQFGRDRESERLDHEEDRQEKMRHYLEEEKND